MTRRYVALLRGINVGGSNIIPMGALRACFEGLGLTDVATYIQSGNVLFSTPRTGAARLERAIEDALSARFRYRSTVVVIPHDVLKGIVEEAPEGFGSDPTGHRYDVIFLKRPLTSRAALEVVEVKDGVDRASAGAHALYFSRLIRRATQSRLSRIIGKSEYKYMTIRNWNTTTALLTLLEGSAGPAAEGRGERGPAGGGRGRRLRARRSTRAVRRSPCTRSARRRS